MWKLHCSTAAGRAAGGWSVDSAAVHQAAAAAAATCCHAASGLLHWTCSCSSASTAPGDRRLEINSSQLARTGKLNPATAEESVVYLAR